MGQSKNILPAVAYGMGFGTLFYVLGGIAQPFFAGITPAVAGAIGLFSAVAINLTTTKD